MESKMNVARFLLTIIALAAIICCASASQEGSEDKHLVEREACKHIVLNRHIGDKSAAGRRQFKMLKDEAYLNCKKCCDAGSYIYHFFTYKVAPFNCQCTNRYRNVLRAD